MPRGSGELTQARREEIVSACARLYQTMSFKDITMNRIAAETTFTRTSIYNYFQTKEEIFLALMEREYRLWVQELDEMRQTHDALSVEAFAGQMGRTLEHRPMLLKLLSMNHFDMEANSRLERLTEFKGAYGASIEAVRRCLKQFFPQMDARARQGFLYAFLPFLFGMYPYTTVTENQRQAMADAGLDFVYMSVYDMVFNCVRALLS